MQTGIYNVGNIRRIIPVKRFPRVWTRVVKKKKKNADQTRFSPYCFLCMLDNRERTDGRTA